jgi:hypothetical protein
MHEGQVESFAEIEEWLSSHERLFGLQTFTLLGRFHLLIDDADDTFWRRVHEEVPTETLFRRLELTAFGHEVGGDSPRWWVFSKESDIAMLWNDTKLAFLAAQTLLRSSEKLERRRFSSYDALVDALSEFLVLHEREIQALLTYAERLAAKHELAPAILFSYSVWGSSRRADRSLDGHDGTSASTCIRVAGELALGLRCRTWSALYRAWLDALEDAFDAAASDEHVVPPSTEELLDRAEHRIKRSLVEYFTEVRDSFRHIDALCQEARQRENIYADDAFLSRLIRKIAEEPRATETELWDLKETLEMWACPPHRRERASVVFAEDVAAFANHRGGILIIGVTDSAHVVVGVPDTENRLKHIESVLQALLDCPADFYRARTVRLDSATCIVIVIGETARPVGVRQVNNSYTYPKRVGPGIERLSRSDVYARKLHAKGTSFAFAAELATWVGL